MKLWILRGYVSKPPTDSFYTNISYTTNCYFTDRECLCKFKFSRTTISISYKCINIHFCLNSIRQSVAETFEIKRRSRGKCATRTPGFEETIIDLRLTIRRSVLLGGLAVPMPLSRGDALSVVSGDRLPEEISSMLCRRS